MNLFLPASDTWKEKSEMASVVKNVLKSVREKGFGAFLRELKDEGYLFVPFLSFALKFPPTNPFNILRIFLVFHFEFLLFSSIFLLFYLSYNLPLLFYFSFSGKCNLGVEMKLRFDLVALCSLFIKCCDWFLLCIIRRNVRGDYWGFLHSMNKVYLYIDTREGCAFVLCWYLLHYCLNFQEMPSGWKSLVS